MQRLELALDEPLQRLHLGVGDQARLGHGLDALFLQEEELLGQLPRLDRAGDLGPGGARARDRRRGLLHLGGGLEQHLPRHVGLHLVEELVDVLCCQEGSALLLLLLLQLLLVGVGVAAED